MLTFIFFCFITCALSREQSKIYLRNGAMEDQGTSASGYMYRKDSNGPATYVEYSDTSGHLESGLPDYKHLPLATNYDHGDEIARIESAVKAESDKHVTAGGSFGDSHEFEGINDKYESIKDGHHSPSLDDSLEVTLGSSHDIPDGYEGIKAYSGIHDIPGTFGHSSAYSDGTSGIHNNPSSFEHGIHSVPHTFGHSSDIGTADSSEFNSAGGNEYDSAERAAHGEQGSTGYINSETYDKGKTGIHEDEGHKEYYNKEGANKKGEYELAHHEGSNHEAGKASEGENHSESKGHKKGSKTTGYHKVYRKDEFKKDHKFYDDADVKGHFNKYGNYDAQHSSKEGAAKEGGKSESSYADESSGRQGAFDKGHYVENDSGKKSESAGDKFHKEHSDYGEKGGHENGKGYTYKKSGGLY